MAYVSENQLSPRVNVVFKPFEGTMLHAGYARFFTPPQQALAGPVNLAAFVPTSAAPNNLQQDPVRAERSHYFDIGMTQKITPELKVASMPITRSRRICLMTGNSARRWCSINSIMSAEKTSAWS